MREQGRKELDRISYKRSKGLMRHQTVEHGTHHLRENASSQNQSQVPNLRGETIPT